MGQSAGRPERLAAFERAVNARNAELLDQRSAQLPRRRALVWVQEISTVVPPTPSVMHRQGSSRYVVEDPLQNSGSLRRSGERYISSVSTTASPCR